MLNLFSVTGLLLFSVVAGAVLAMLRPRHALWILLLYIPLNELVRTVLLDRTTLGLTYKDILFLGMLCGWLAGNLSRGRLPGVPRSIGVPLLFLTLWSLVEFLNPAIISRYAGLLQFRVQCLYPLLLLWAADSARAEMTRREAIAFVVLGTLEAMYGIIQQFIPLQTMVNAGLIDLGVRAGPVALGQFYLTEGLGSIALRSFGTTTGPLNFGSYMAIVVLLVVALLRGTAGRARLLLGGALVLCLLGLYFALVRTPWVTFVIALGIYLAMTYGHWRTFVAGAVFLVIVFNAPVPVLHDRLLGENSAFGQDSTLASRVAVTNEKLPSALGNLIGTGIGNDGITANGVLVPIAGGTENVYVKVAQEEGLVGLLLFVWLRLAILWALYQAAVRLDGEHVALARAALALAVAFFIADYSAFYTEQLPTGWLLWGLIGTVVGLASRASYPVPREARQGVMIQRGRQRRLAHGRGA